MHASMPSSNYQYRQDERKTVRNKDERFLRDSTSCSIGRSATTMRFQLVFVVFFSLTHVNVVYSMKNPFGSSNNKNYINGEVAAKNPFDTKTDRDEANGWQEVLFPAVTSLATASYGSALVVYGSLCPSQVRALTMFRATGNDKLAQAIQAARRNFRDARYTLVWRAPSFLMARRSMKRLQDRVDLQRKILEECRQAKADGTVTPVEARKIKKMKKEQIRLLKTDMRRLVKAGSNLRDVLKALDLNELRDITNSFLFQMLAVLSAGDEDKRGLGTLVARWCLFLNLGSLVVDTVRKLNYPVARIVHRLFTNQEIAKYFRKEGTQEAVKVTGNVIMYAASGYMVVAKNTLARQLNGAILSSAVVMKGLKGFTKTMLDWDDDDDDGIWPFVGRFLEGVSGGFVIVALTATSLRARHYNETMRQPLEGPNWVLKPLLAVEKGIDRVADELDNIF